VCDRCVIMKNGRKVGEIKTSDISKDDLANIIITGEMKTASSAELRLSA